MAWSESRLAVGIALPTNRIRLTGPVLRNAIAALEDAGCQSVWVNDHLAGFRAGADSYPYSRDGKIDWDPDTPQYEAVCVCAFACAATRSLRIGTSVLILPQRHPIAVAKAACTLADLSGGRFVLGAGLGWAARMDEGLAILRFVFGCGSRPTSLCYYSLPDDIIFSPRPSEEDCPLILIGGMSAAARSRASRRGDGWLAVVGDSTEELDRAGRHLAKLRAVAGRPLIGVVKISMSAAEPARAARHVQSAAEDGWDEVSFEFGAWDLADVCALIRNCVQAREGC
jgi:alkanesulfonate monooxygenase SsuD/methylene tetrahydromethanopterin reductase-like flavin-dependent oxidoreductase (luciferase family)